MHETKHHKTLHLEQEQSLQFSNPITVNFPQLTSQKQYSSIFRMKTFSQLLRGSVTKQQQNRNRVYQQIIHISNQIFFMMKGNSITVYLYEGNYTNKTQQKGLCLFQQQTQKQSINNIKCEPILIIQLSFNTKQISIFQSEKIPKDKHFYFIAIDSTSRMIQLFSFFPLKRSAMSVKSIKTQSKINCLSFVDAGQIIFWCENMLIYHYQLSQRGFKKLTIINSGIDTKKQFTCQINRHQLKKNKIVTEDKFRKHKQNKKNHHQNQQKAHILYENFELDYSAILGTKKYGEQSILVLFYVLYNPNLNLMKIKCRQIMYPFQEYIREKQYSFLQKIGLTRQSQNAIYMLQKVDEQSEQKTNSSYEIVSRNWAYSQILKCQKITKINNAYLAKFEFEVIVIDKKFGKYYAIDNVYKKDKNCQITMSSNSNLIACIHEDFLQINKINMAISDTKAHSKMIDFLDLRIKRQQENRLPISHESFRRKIMQQKPQKQIQWLKKYEPQPIKKAVRNFWVAEDTKTVPKNRKQCLFFVLELNIPDRNGLQKKFICLYQAKPSMKLRKLTKLAKQSLIEEQMKQIQKIGQNLGVDKTKFYLNLWKQSNQNMQDLKQYLIKCESYQSIMHQLKYYLKKKDMPAAILFRILKKMKQLTIKKIREKLSEERIQNYLQICFIVRKFKIYSNQYMVGQKQFKQCVSSSLYDFISNIISRELFKVKKQLSPWQAQPKQPPKLDLLQMLHQFKLPLLQNYFQFLQKIIQKFSDNLIKVIQNFPMLLPIYPYNSPVEYISLQQSLLPFNLNFKTKQQGIFTQIFKNDLRLEESFLENIQYDLQKYFPTTEVKKTLRNTLKRHEIDGKKFISHSIISTQIGKYIQNVDQIKAEYLYLFTIHKFIVNSTQKNLKVHITTLINLFEKKYQMTKILTKKIHLTSNLYYLYLKEQIITEEINIIDIFNDPIEKWIALLFLGNRQKKYLLFDEFLDIFDSSDQFLKALKSFIFSEHSSKIQLSLIIQLVDDKLKKHQKIFSSQDQQILDDIDNPELDLHTIVQIIIDGFSSKIYPQDDADAAIFQKHIKKISLSSNSLIKLQKIKNIMTWGMILQSFNLGNMHIKDFLDDPYQVINAMFQTFFNQTLLTKLLFKKPQYTKNSYLYGYSCQKIQFADIDSIPSLIKLIIDMREQIFWQVDDSSLIMLICRKLIEWQRFLEVKAFIYQSEQMVEYLSKNKQEVVSQLIDESLNTLYNNQQLYFDPQTITYINNILSIDKDGDQNPRVIQQRAKLQLVELFNKWGNPITQKYSQSVIELSLLESEGSFENRQQWIKQDGYTIKLINLDIMCSMWNEAQIQTNEIEKDSQEVIIKNFIIQMIQNYGKFIDLESLKTIYRLFKTISESINIPTQRCQYIYENTQFYIYCQKLAQVLLKTERLDKACYVLGFLNLKVQPQYQLSITCFLQALISNYKSQQTNKIFSSQQNQLVLPVRSLIINKEKVESVFQFNYKQRDQGSYVKNQKVCQMKKKIDYFIFEWNASNNKKISELFLSLLQEKSIRNQQQNFYVHKSICYDQQKIKIPTDDLWDFVVVSLSEQKSNSALKSQQIRNNNSIKKLKNTVSLQIVIYSYFFMAMGLMNPQLGFGSIQEIRYDHSSLCKCISNIEDYSHVLQTFFALDIPNIYRIYLTSLINSLLINKIMEQHQNFLIQSQNHQNASVHTSSQILSPQSNESMFNTLNNSAFQGLKQITDKTNDFDFIKEQIRANVFKQNPLTKYVLKLMELFNKAKKPQHIEYRKSLKKETTKKQRNFVSLNKISQVYNELPQTPLKKFNQTVNNLVKDEEEMKLSFLEFQKIKSQIKKQVKNKSVDAKNDQGPTERQVIQSIIKYINPKHEPNSYSNQQSKLQQSIINIFDQDSPIIKKFVKNAQQKNDQSPNAIKVNKVDINEKFQFQPVSVNSNQQVMTDEEFLLNLEQNNLQVIVQNMKEQQLIDKIEKQYHSQQLKFDKIIKLLHLQNQNQSYNSDILNIDSQIDQNKIAVLHLAQPQKYVTSKNNRYMKLIFPFDYICKQFQKYNEHQQNICIKLQSLPKLQNFDDYDQIIRYIAEIQKIQYKKHPQYSQLYRNKIGEQFLSKLAKQGQYTTENVELVDSIISFLGQKGYSSWLKQHKQFIKKQFIKFDHQKLGQWFIQCIQSWNKRWTYQK